MHLAVIMTIDCAARSV